MTAPLANAGKIAAGLTEAQRKRVMQLRPGSHAGFRLDEVTDGLVMTGLIEMDGLTATPLGLAVRAELEASK